MTDKQHQLPDSILNALAFEREKLAIKLERSQADKQDYLASFESESEHEATLISRIKDIDSVVPRG